MSNIKEEVKTTSGVVRLIETDNGPISAKNRVEVIGEDWEILRWFFFDEFDERKAKQFGLKTIYNPEVRRAALEGKASWVKVQNLYLRVEEAIVSAFEEKNLFDISPTVVDAKRREEWGQNKLWELLQEIYESVSYAIQELSLSPTHLEPYIESQVKAANGVAAMIDSESDVSTNSVRPRDLFLEYRSSETQEWIVDDLNANIITVIKAYNREYGPVAGIISPYKKKDTIKNLEWEKCHPTWNPEGGLWEVDLDSLTYVTKAFSRQNQIVRIADPVAYLSDLDCPDRPDLIRPHWKLPTMLPKSYQKSPAATDLLRLPGIDSLRSRALLNGGFYSVPEIAHASMEELTDVHGIGLKMGQIAKEGARAAVGQRTPSAVTLVKETKLSIPEAQRVIAVLASDGNPPSETTETLLEIYQTSLPVIEHANTLNLYNIYTKGYHCLSDIADTAVTELSQIKYIDKKTAKNIQCDAQSLE